VYLLETYFQFHQAIRVCCVDPRSCIPQNDNVAKYNMKSSLGTSSSEAGDARMENGESAAGAAQLPFIRSHDLPETGHEWVSLTPSVQFLPAQDRMAHVAMPRKPLGSHSERSHDQNQRHGDKKGTEKQQAESSFRSSRNDESELGLLTAAQYKRRFLEDEAVYNREDNAQYRVQPFVEGVSDYDTYQQAWRMLGFMIDCDDPNQNNNGDDDHHSGSNDENETGQGCRRYVLWAAVREACLCAAIIVGLVYARLGPCLNSHAAQPFS
jgi:hypothetical protein